MLDDFVIVSLFLLNAAEMNHVNKDTHLNWKQLSSKNKYTKIYFVISGAGQEKVLSVNAETGPSFFIISAGNVTIMVVFFFSPLQET